jgi:hypothetical protein
MFWGLDGYFLRQERLFRKLYDRHRTKDSNIDFSMDTSTVDSQGEGWFKVCRSRTLLTFHGVLVITVIIVNVMVCLHR